LQHVRQNATPRAGQPTEQTNLFGGISLLDSGIQMGLELTGDLDCWLRKAETARFLGESPAIVRFSEPLAGVKYDGGPRDTGPQISRCDSNLQSIYSVFRRVLLRV
jgi:hypothetical protein